MHQGADWPNGNPLFVSLPSVIPDAIELYITKERGILYEPHALILAGGWDEGMRFKGEGVGRDSNGTFFLVTFF